jgi:hypothetical protein
MSGSPWGSATIFLVLRRGATAGDRRRQIGKDALDTCKDQLDARQAVCERLGEAPYDPVINPANFVTTIDNPYFPLTPGTTFI